MFERARHLHCQSKHRLTGMTMGAQGFAQAGFQIPFGRWSGRYGRRPLLFIGLALLLLPSEAVDGQHDIWLV